MRGIVLLFAVLGIGLVAAVRFLPWWALPALFACLVLAVVVLWKWGLRRLLLIPFRAKGAVLRAAVVDVHAIERVESPADAPAEGGPRDYWRLEITITPREPAGPFRLWEPGELRAVGADARPGEPRANETQFDVSALEVREDGAFAADTGMKYGGPQRLRLQVAVPSGHRQIRFRYYLEVFGRLALPGPTGGDAFRRRVALTR